MCIRDRLVACSIGAAIRVTVLDDAFDAPVPSAEQTTEAAPPQKIVESPAATAQSTTEAPEVKKDVTDSSQEKKAPPVGDRKAEAGLEDADQKVKEAEKKEERINKKKFKSVINGVTHPKVNKGLADRWEAVRHAGMQTAVRIKGSDEEDDTCLLYTSDAADDLLCVDLGGRRIIKKKTYRYI
eukprot:TRINITY_DN4391_c0_g1_i1.p2 TRINITY_DN4391_c0_g1~~TRINITY_DN4391_c0_g1_i1.p2  ORF type:complete len:183 (-),score=75.59 TRINITY_DN4391_c0_g1_i1:80-628(-)